MYALLSKLKSRPLPKAFFLCLFLLCLTEAVADRYQQLFWTQTSNLIAHKKDLLLDGNDPPPRNNAIILGDSRILRVDANYLSEHVSTSLGQDFRIYNLAIPNHGVRSYHMLLKKYLKYNPRPDYILIAITPIATAGEYSLDNSFARPHSLYMLAQLYSLRELTGILPLKTYLAMLSIKVESFSSLILYRGKIREFLQDPDWKNLERMRTQQRQLQKYNGGHLTRRPAPMPLDEIKEIKYFDRPVYPEEEAVRWYREAFRVAGQNGITVLIANTPQLEDIKINRDRDGSNGRYTDLIRRFTEEFDNVRVLPPTVRFYSLDYFEDWHHLNQQGAQRFTKELAQGFADYLRSTPR